MTDPITFLKALIRAQRDGEAAVQRLVAAEARSLGCSVELVRYRPGDVPMVGEFASARAIDAGERESVVARFAGSGGGRSLIFFAHPDGEPVAGTERWKRDPFAGIVDGGRIHGWGAADDLSGVAIMIEGLRAALTSGRAPAGEVILASTPSKRHARGVSALLHGGLRADAAVYLHPAESGVGLREIKAFCLGQLDFRITVQGTPPETNEISHLAFTHQASNPADLLTDIHRRLSALVARRGEMLRHPLLERSANLLISHLDVGRAGAHTRIAAQGIMEGALTLLPGEDMASVQRDMAAAVGEGARLDWVSGVSGAEVPIDSPLYRLVAQSIAAVTGQPPHVNPLHTASDIRNPIVQAGIPTVGFGPLGGGLTQNGLTDEWVDVEDYRRAVKVAAAIIDGWCGTV
ncbi:M20 family metallopeptidase [Reyranella sp.]|uniref:M20 family metallopeptidase n=1 Tax=Reyranella sp. TaxID=1929291 RepID=UPI003D11AABB